MTASTFRILLALSLAAAATGASAQVVSSVTGTFADGQQIVVNGSSFGSAPTVVVFDDFESCQSGNGLVCDGDTIRVQIKEGASDAKVGGWANRCDDRNLPSGCNPATYTSSRNHSGVLSAKWQADGTNAYWRQELQATFGSTSQVFLYHWVYVPSGDCIPGSSGCVGSNWKANWIMRGNSTVDDDRTMVTSDGGVSGNRFGSNSDTSSFWLGGYQFARDKWLNHQFWSYAGTSGGNWQDGAVGAWGIDGGSGATFTQWMNQSGVDVQDNENNGKTFIGYDRILVNAYASPQSGGNTFRPGMDDVYVAVGSNARARVMIADASTLESATNVTLCTTGGAGDSWGSSSITCTVRQGSFTGGSVWVYVVDGSGSFSSGDGPYSWDQATANPECSDGVDNDADTLIDFPNDPGCTSTVDDDEADGPPPSPTIRRGDTLGG